MAHTPGPWAWRWSQPLNTLVIEAGDGYIARNISNDNARLIAAAPELLAASRLANQELIDLGVGSSGSPALVALWAAIAKAEGRE